MHRCYLLSLLLLTGVANAFQCEETTLEQQYDNAHHVVLVKIINTRLENSELFDIAPEDDENISIISAGFEILEQFKGSVEPDSRLIEVLGIGTGYAGLTSGLTFLIALEDMEDIPLGYFYINYCMVVKGYHRESEQGVIETLSTIRTLADRI